MADNLDIPSENEPLRSQGPLPAPVPAPASAPTTPASSIPAGSTPGPGTDESPTLLAAPATQVAAAAPTDAVHTATGRAFGRYRLVRELGRGGMGVVYLAWRPDLQVHFALKVLLAGPDAPAELLLRFQREAQAAARLRHPGIVAVHDAGIEDGKAYIAMDYVEGVSLAVAAHDPARAGLAVPAADAAGHQRRGLCVRDAVRLVREAAAAIEHAHRAGVIHRDLKPGNLLLDRDAHVHVADFGLARLLETPAGGPVSRITRSGAFLGTLAYMPPEQAEGMPHEIDARGDVYALGVVLFELVTGRLPFDAEGHADLFQQVLLAEAPSPRAANPELPADLEAVILKAMAKEPAQRYSDAGGFATDLDRFLAGQAIEIRPPGAWRRARTCLRRSGLRFAVLAAVALLAALAAAATGRAWFLERQKSALRTRVLLDLRQKAAAYVDAALTLRRSGMPMQKARAEYLPALERAVAAAEAADPTGAEPHYHLGRMHRAFLQRAAALHEQDEALHREPGFAPSLYERAILTAEACDERLLTLRAQALAAAGERLARAGGLASGAATEERLVVASDDDLARADTESTRLLAQCHADLDRLAAAASAPSAPSAPSAGGAGPTAVTSARLDCARGLALVHESAAPAARRAAADLLSRALAQEPTLEEAWLGMAALAAAEGRWAEAIATYGRGLERDRGFVPFWGGRAALHAYVGQRRLAAGGDPDPELAAAVADFTHALDLDPADVPSWLGRGCVHMNQGVARMKRGQDPRPCWSDAVGDYDRAVALDPASAEARADRADVRQNLALYLMGHGADAEAAFRAAETDFGKALELQPGAASVWARRGGLRVSRGECAAGRGGDPEPAYAHAAADFGKALELDPLDPESWLRRGRLQLTWALWRGGRGADPERSYAAGEADLGKALELAPQLATAWADRGTLRADRAIDAMARGGDPEALFAGAETDLTRALALDPAAAATFLTRGNLRANRGLHRSRRGGDPDPDYDDAAADYDRAVALDPATAEAWAGRGRLRLNRGVHAMGRGGDPEGQFAGAAADFARTAELNATWAQAWAWRGSLCVDWGAWRKSRGDDPEPLYREGVTWFGKALDLNPSWAEPWAHRGSLRYNWGAHRADLGGDPRPLYADAASDLARALELNPGDAVTWKTRGIVMDAWGVWLERRGVDPADRFAESLRCLDQALRLNPRDADAHRQRATAYRRGGRWGDVLADLEAALGLDPALAPALQADLADVRARIERAKKR